MSRTYRRKEFWGTHFEEWFVGPQYFDEDGYPKPDVYCHFDTIGQAYANYRGDRQGWYHGPGKWWRRSQHRKLRAQTRTKLHRVLRGSEEEVFDKRTVSWNDWW